MSEVIPILDYNKVTRRPRVEAFIIGGVPLDGDSTERDSGNEQTGLLGPSEQFIGQYSYIADHKAFLILYASFEPFTALLRWSVDGVNADTGLLGSSPLTVRQDEATGYYFVISVQNTPLRPYYRLEVTNDTTPQTPGVLSLAIKSNTSILGTVGSLNTPPTINSIAQLVRAIDTAQDPSGVFHNAVFGGALPLTPTPAPLGAAGTYTSDWFNVAGHVALSVLIATGQVSASLGIQIDWSNDGVNVRRTVPLTYSASDATNGSKFFTVAVAADYVRIRYTNGGTPQVAFFLEVQANPYALEQARDSIESEISPISTATMVRTILAARDPLGVYGNILRSTLGGLRVSLREQEAELQAKTTETHVHHSITAPATGVQPVRLDTGGPFANRKYITIGNPSGGTIYYRIDDASSWVVGIPIPPDAVVQEEVGPSNAIHVVSASNSTRIVHGISHSGTV